MSAVGPSEGPGVALTDAALPAHHRRDGSDDMSDPTDTAALRAVAEAATPGPWDLLPDEGGVTDVIGPWSDEPTVDR